MVLLLVAVSVIYFVTGNTGDALFMLAAIIAIVSISLYQDRRSQKALNALRVLTTPNCRVLRNGTIASIPVAEVVIGDCLLAEEGAIIAADGVIIQANDFAVNESLLTGEALSVEKSVDEEKNEVYQGTTVTRGLAVCKVTAIGEKTRFGEIGRTLREGEAPETPLQKQIGLFVRRMALTGAMFFVAVWLINFYRSHNILESLLKALSLAISIVPEEIPVAFVTFMAIGAWRLSRLGIIVKNVSTVETLGSASVICVDKTGTITKNQMDLKDVYVFSFNSVEKPDGRNPAANNLLTYAMWASEPIPFDPMESALHQAYSGIAEQDERKECRMVHEYPLGGHPPFMTHVFVRKDGSRIIAAKGAPEGIIAVCNLTPEEIQKITGKVHQLSATGARVLGVASGIWNGSDFPESQTSIPFTFLGLVSFYDPPKENVKKVLSDLYKAGLEVKMITGDFPETAASIAKEIGLKGDRVMTGKDIMQLHEPSLQQSVKDVNVFARTSPETKLKILSALKHNGHVVAMTGDGINDAPALKAAHIGVAMGKRGTEVAKQASAMILSDDDLQRMVDAVAAGRKIYANLKKAIQYIISIHIPIILMALVPLMLNWRYVFLFTPVHVIFLELIMGPTCSIVYENEPFEKELMQQKPRVASTGFFNGRELTMSIIQGIGISIGAIIVYQYSTLNELSEELTRAMVFTTLISANIFLTLVNRSLTKPFWVSIKYRNPLVPLIILVTIGLALMILFVDPVSHFFQVTPPRAGQLLFACVAGFGSVIWVDLVKVLKVRPGRVSAILIILLLWSNTAQPQDSSLRSMVEETHNLEVRKFYESNNYSLAWTDRQQARELITFIQSISLDGLDPDDYNIQYLASSMHNAGPERDLALTESFIDIAHDLYQGRVDPDKLFPGDWEACTAQADYSGLLSSALNGTGICEILELLKPMDNGYEGLKYMLSRFRDIETNNTFQPIALGDPIKPGDCDERFADIRTRLSLLGMMLPELDNGDILYDSILVGAVKQFQRLHGLTPDGTIGRRTQQAMQLTTTDYISAIVVNLEKYRWHQSRLLARSIKVNIPSFDLILSENERTEFRLRVIIGRKERPTPVVNSVITGMIINPTWTVPPTILKEDLLPVIKGDPGYLTRHNMKVINARRQEVDPDSLDWSKISAQHFPFYIQQDPGPNNPLGLIKFIFPNHHSVYLHDTNMPSLFSGQERAISSGCIRIESPMVLVRLFTPVTGWTEQMVRDQIDSGETRLVLIKDPLAIHLTYFTAYVNNGELFILKDVYGYDKVIQNALQEKKKPLLR